MINVNVMKRIMGSVLRIALMNLLDLFRLAVVASLVFYTLPTAAFAMHGSESSSVAMNLGDTLADQALMDVPADHHDHGVAKEAAKKDRNQDKPNCCTDFCISLAIIAESPDVGFQRNDSVMQFLNDGFVFGQLQSLHRPPSIRV